MAFLTGHSGAGKSTLLKLISVMERPTDGRVFFHGDDVSHIQRSQIPVRRQIGMIFPDHRLLMDRTVFDNVALPLVIDGYSHGDINKRVAAAPTRSGCSARSATSRACSPVVSSSGSASPAPSSTSRPAAGG